MQNVVIIEVISTGRFYVKEVADRGLHPIVIYPKLVDILPLVKTRGFLRAVHSFILYTTFGGFLLLTN